MRKLLILFFLAACLQIPFQTRGQGISLEVQDMPLENVFNLVQRQSAYRFIYTNEQLTDARKVTVSVTNAPITKVLDVIFRGQPVGYNLKGQVVMITSKKNAVTTRGTGGIEITGKVINEQGDGLPAVTVLLKGNASATATDDKGNFILKNVDPAAMLVVSSIGYESKEVLVAGRTNIIIQLTRSVSALDETVIKGYYSTSKRFNTGSVTKVSSAEISKSPVSNVLSAIQGRASGIYITQQTGVTGGNYSILIRGINSLNAGNDPLYIVDGVPFTATSIGSTAISSGIIRQGSPLNSINPADIESVEILKDADATSIYGSRGANGVVLITTKKGTVGKTGFEINATEGIGQVAHFIPLLNTGQYLQMRHEAFNNDGQTPVAEDFDVNGTWDSTRNSNWQKILIGNISRYTNVQASLTGGNKNTQFDAGGNFHNETTVFPGTMNNYRAGARFSLHHLSENQKFGMQLSANYSKNISRLPVFDLTYIALNLPPDAPSLYKQTGDINWENSTWDNPVSYLLQPYKSTTANLITNAVFSYKLLPGLEVKSNVGYTSMNIDETATSPITSFRPAYNITTGSAQFSSANLETWIIEPQANWTKNTRHGLINVLIGTSFQQSKATRESVSGTGYSSDALLGNMQAAAKLRVDESVHTDYRYNAIFGRAGYTHLNKYLINLTARRDGSSRFGPGRQFANFAAAGAGWIFSKESFFQKHLPFISYGKIRTSYGITGNDQIPDYGFMDTYSSVFYSYQGISGIYPTSLFNPDYGWETNKKFDAAIELGFLNNRILLTADYYRNKSSNQLTGYPLAPTTGFTSLPYFNLPATVINSGFEFELNSVNLNAKHFKWTTSINLTIPRNKLQDYPNLASSNYVYRYLIGQPLTIERTFTALGVNKQSGVYEFKDVDGNGSLNATDLESKVNVAQKFYGGIQNNLSWKNFEFSVLVQFVHQTGYEYFYNNMFTNPGGIGNQPADVLYRWQKTGDDSRIQKFTQDQGGPGYLAYIYESGYGDHYVINASFVRIKNVSLSYGLPGKWIQKLHFSGFTVYAQAQNLLTFTPYKGLDPENNGAGRLPPIRVITMGIKINL